MNRFKNMRDDELVDKFFGRSKKKSNMNGIGKLYNKFFPPPVVEVEPEAETEEEQRARKYRESCGIDEEKYQASKEWLERHPNWYRACRVPSPAEKTLFWVRLIGIIVVLFVLGVLLSHV